MELGRIDTTLAVSPLLAPPLAMGPDDQYLAVGDREGGITIFDCYRRAKVLAITKAHEPLHPAGLQWQADGRHLVSTGSINGSLKVWELCLQRYRSRLAHAVFSPQPLAFVIPQPLAFSPDGHWLATPTTASGGPIEIVDRASGEVAAAGRERHAALLARRPLARRGQQDDDDRERWSVGQEGHANSDRHASRRGIRS